MQNARERAPAAFGNDFDNRTDSTTALQKSTHRQVFVVSLRASSDRDSIHALRAALKLLWRRFGLRCLHIEERADVEEGKR